MSYILEALRKADQERSAGSVPDLEAVHESTSQSGSSYRWIWILGVILALNGMLLAVILLRDGHDEPAPVVEDSPAPPQRKIVREPPAPPPAVVVSRPAPRAPPPAVTARKPVTVAATPPVQARAPSPVPPVVPIAREGVAGITPVSPPPAPEVSRRADSQAITPPVSTPTVPQASRSVPPQPAAPSGSDSGIPYWDDMSLEFRSGLSMPRLDVHVYDSNPQRRFLLVELKKYREGDTLTNGAVVEEILPDGIQLFYRGTRFVYRK